MSLELVLLLAPGALLFVALLLGRYPGEDAIDRARRAPVAAPRPRPAVRLLVVASAPLLPRGGRLIGSGIAARPPPACG